MGLTVSVPDNKSSDINQHNDSDKQKNGIEVNKYEKQDDDIKVEDNKEQRQELVKSDDIKVEDNKEQRQELVKDDDSNNKSFIAYSGSYDENVIYVSPDIVASLYPNLGGCYFPDVIGFDINYMVSRLLTDERLKFIEDWNSNELHRHIVRKLDGTCIRIGHYEIEKTGPERDNFNIWHLR
jgi:hypothetical protein